MNKNFICFLEKCKERYLNNSYIRTIYEYWLNCYEYNSSNFCDRITRSISFIELKKNKTNSQSIMLYHRKIILSAYKIIVK